VRSPFFVSSPAPASAAREGKNATSKARPNPNPRACPSGWAAPLPGNHLPPRRRLPLRYAAHPPGIPCSPTSRASVLSTAASRPDEKRPIVGGNRHPHLERPVEAGWSRKSPSPSPVWFWSSISFFRAEDGDTNGAHNRRPRSSPSTAFRSGCSRMSGYRQTLDCRGVRPSAGPTFPQLLLVFPEGERSPRRFPKHRGRGLHRAGRPAPPVPQAKPLRPARQHGLRLVRHHQADLAHGPRTSGPQSRSQVPCLRRNWRRSCAPSAGRSARVDGPT